jgi:hypothetical protein
MQKIKTKTKKKSITYPHKGKTKRGESIQEQIFKTIQTLKNVSQKYKK